MTRYERTTWSRLGEAARALGDAVATPRGAAPGRADRSAAMWRARI